MKTDLTTQGNPPQSKAVKHEARRKLLPGQLPEIPEKKPSPDYKVELSSKSLPSIPTPPVPPMPSLPSAPSMPSAPEVKGPEPKKEDDIKTKEMKKVEVPEVKNGSVKRPAIFFIKGLDLFSNPLKSEGGYAGVGRMAESVEGAGIYGWNQKDEMIKEIRKVHKDYPVVLVGHSLGGDTAVEIADKLDSLDEGFRKVDLLITIDSIGFSNNIIPQNVEKHLNVFGEKSLFLAGGPNVARREEKTNVRNILTDLYHTEIDDDREVQYEVINLIQDVLKRSSP